MSENSRFDVVVVGAGPAGMMAAFAASSQTSSVAVLDENPFPGGQIWRPDIATGWSREARAALKVFRKLPATVLQTACVVDAARVSGRFRLTLESMAGPAVVETSTIILATGARELFLPFPGWTLPGMFGVGGVQAMAKSGMSVRGKRIVLGGTGPLLMAVAASLVSKGAEVLAVAEQAPLRRLVPFGFRLAAKPKVARDALRYAMALPGGVLRFGSWISAAHGRDRVEAVTITNGRNTQRVECDFACVGYGLLPNTELARLLGCEATDAGIVVDQHQRTSVEGVLAAGECTGIGGADAAVEQGLNAGGTANGLSELFPEGWHRREQLGWSRALATTFALRPEVLALAKPETIICRCEDVRLGAIDEGWNARQAKLYARVGMGACQGRVCGAAMRAIRQWDLDSVRAPLQPITLSSLAAPSADELNRS